MWKNQNSFVARLTTQEFCPWVDFSICAIRGALEEKPVEEPARQMRLWVACEWIIRCSEVIRHFLAVAERQEDPMLAIGELCPKDMQQLSLERWEFWKKRLQELSTDAEKLELNEENAERMSEALKKMETVSPKAGVSSEVKSPS